MGNTPEQRQRRRQRLRTFIREYKAIHSYVDCGNTDELTFDHRDPQQKEANIGKLVRQNCGLKRLQEEIAKCDVRCIICHRIRHDQYTISFYQEREPK